MVDRSISKLMSILVFLFLLVSSVFASGDSDDLSGRDDDSSRTTPKSISASNKHGVDKTYSTAGFIDLNRGR